MRLTANIQAEFAQGLDTAAEFLTKHMDAKMNSVLRHTLNGLGFPAGQSGQGEQGHQHHDHDAKALR